MFHFAGRQGLHKKAMKDIGKNKIPAEIKNNKALAKEEGLLPPIRKQRKELPARVVKLHVNKALRMNGILMK